MPLKFLIFLLPSVTSAHKFVARKNLLREHMQPNQNVDDAAVIRHTFLRNHHDDREHSTIGLSHVVVPSEK